MKHKKIKMNQIKKTFYGLIEDLTNHLYLLDQSIENFTQHPAQSSVARSLLKYIENMPQDALEEYNNTFIHN